MSADDKTIRLLEQLVASQPDNWEARQHLAEIYLGRGDAVSAHRVLTSSGPMPDQQPLQLLLGEVLSKSDPSRAIGHFEEMIRKDKRCAPAYLSLARIYRSRGMRTEARRVYSIGTVIDERLEDPELRAWVEGEAPQPPSPAPSPLPPAAEEWTEVEYEQGRDDAPEADPVPEPPPLPIVRFKDVGGMEEVKERIRMSIIYPFRNPQIFQKFKKKSGGGILLYGPPGCGKTHMARATAGECDVPFLSIGITDVLSRWMGESEHRLHQLFELARRRSPSVIFIDEVDALGMSRHDARGSAMATVINQLLTELDGVQARNDHLMVLAATNAPWSVDAAFRRPGRFDRVLFVPPPDAAARRAILEIHLREIPHEPLDYDKLVKATDKFSGADLRALVDRSGEEAIYQEMRGGKSGQITMKALLAAIKQTKPSTLEWLETARSYASYSNRSGQYDDLAQYFDRER